MNISTVLTPLLFEEYSHGISEKNVVIIDILRATTTIVMAYKHGAKEIIPVKTAEEALSYRQKGYLIAGERNGITLDGFDFGNSPQECTIERVYGKRIAITTTNGTQATEASKNAHHRYISSFLNLQATAEALYADQRDVILFCAGWKNNFNLEDTLFAGALAQSIIDNSPSTITITDDATRMALLLWQMGKSNPAEFLKDASHVQRFKSIHAESDLEVCLQLDTWPFAVVI